MVYNVIITEIVGAKNITVTDGIYSSCVRKEGLLPSFEGHSLSVWQLNKVVKWLVWAMALAASVSMDPVVVCPTPHSKEKKDYSTNSVLILIHCFISCSCSHVMRGLLLLLEKGPIRRVKNTQS